MRELHVVALSEDGRSVVLATTRKAKKGAFRVALDERLNAAVRGDLARAGETAPRASAVTPKEIQARLRAGESAEAIAKDAGVAVARVERFSGPVFSERSRIINELRNATMVRGRRGPSAVPLGAAVDEQLARAPEESVLWSALRREDGIWHVEVSYVLRGRAKKARWLFDRADGSIRPVDNPSAALGHLEKAPAKPVKTPPVVVAEAAPEPIVEPKPARKRAARKAAAKAPARKAPARKAPAKKSAARPATAKRPAAKKAAPQAADTRSPATKSAAKKTAAAKAAAGAKKTAASKTAVSKAAARTAATKAARKAPRKAAAEVEVIETAEVAVPEVATPAVEAAENATPEVATRAATESAAPSAAGEPPVLRVVQDETPADGPDTTEETEEHRPAAKSRAAGRGRATVPAWSDVLFGATATRPEASSEQSDGSD